MITIRHQKRGRFWNYLRSAVHFARSLRSWLGGIDRECSVCSHRGRFLAYGQPPRFDALCPLCGSLERHRLLALWLRQNSKAYSAKEVLHFAPEEVIGEILSRDCSRYVDADLKGGKARHALNLEDIDLPTASVDLVLCSHVLEHVNDRKALAEISRVLRPGGVALLMVPIVEGWSQTLEAEHLPVEVSTARDRTLYFGQHDHVRYYGRDLRDRIRSAGFMLSEFTAREPEVSRHALVRGEVLFVAVKP